MSNKTQKPFILLVGESGCGKTSLLNALQDYGYVPISSYTTRAPRYKGEVGHTFIESKKSDFSDVKARFTNRVAETVFDGAFYFATEEQVEQSDLYVIDLNGIKTFKERYSGKRKVIIVYLRVPEFLRRMRMERRGDSVEDIDGRIEHDKIAFAGVREICDHIIYNFVLSESVAAMVELIEGKKRRGSHE